MKVVVPRQQMVQSAIQDIVFSPQVSKVEVPRRAGQQCGSSTNVGYTIEKDSFRLKMEKMDLGNDC